jgi:hypothetical protein
LSGSDLNLTPLLLIAAAVACASLAISAWWATQREDTDE